MIIEDKEEMSKKIIKAIFILIAGLAIGVLITALYYRGKIKKLETAASQSSQTQDKNREALGSIVPPEMPKIPIPNEITSISGTVEKIEGGKITLNANFFGEKKTLFISTDENTKVVKREMLKEIPKPEDGKTPSIFKETDATFSDIRQNDTLNIEASENIKDKTEFIAKTIYIQIMNIHVPPAPPAGVPLSAPATPPVPTTPPNIPGVPAP